MVLRQPSAPVCCIAHHQLRCIVHDPILAFETRGAACWFESEYGDPPVEFAQLGINVTVLEPGQRGVYHAESNQEAFLVLAGACRLLVEGEERGLEPWDTGPGE